MAEFDKEKITVVLDTLTLTTIKDVNIALELAWGDQSAITNILVPVMKGRRDYQLFREKVHLHLPYNRTTNVAALLSGVHIPAAGRPQHETDDVRHRQPWPM